jgi:hypothetical protein
VFLASIKLHREKIFLFILFLITFIVYSITKIETPHNHFIRLSESFLEGHLYLENPPTYLELDGHDGDLRRYVAYPPMPAIVSIPFVIFNIASKSQTFISILFASINIPLFFLLCKRIYKNKFIALFLSIALAFGTNIWYLASEGSSWYFAHVLAIFFLISALLVIDLKKSNNQIEATYNKSLWLISGLFVGAAYLTRIQMILIIPFFILVLLLSSREIYGLRELIDAKYLLKKTLKHNKLIGVFILSIMIFVFVNWNYNYARFGTIRDVGYEKIQGVLEEPWYDHGIFSTFYIPRNIQFIIATMPLPYEHFPYVKPSIFGMSILLTSPFLFLFPFIKWKNKISFLAFFTGLLLLIPPILHGNTGGTQFGYRYAAESMPFFLISFGSVLERKRLGLIALMLIIFAIIINIWGILFIRFLHITG